MKFEIFKSSTDRPFFLYGQLRIQVKGGGLFSAVEHHQAVARQEIGILNLRDRIEWEGFRSLLVELNGYDKRDWSKGVQPLLDPLFIFFKRNSDMKWQRGIQRSL